jgi:hypothetical protein
MLCNSSFSLIPDHPFHLLVWIIEVLLYYQISRENILMES